VFYGAPEEQRWVLWRQLADKINQTLIPESLLSQPLQEVGMKVAELLEVSHEAVVFLQGVDGTIVVHDSVHRL
jgi:hypothetical protein